MSIACCRVNVIEYLSMSLLIGLRALNFENLMDPLLHSSFQFLQKFLHAYDLIYLPLSNIS